MDGKFVPWHDANVHVLTHTLHYGLGVFEGIRCYQTKNIDVYVTIIIAFAIGLATLTPFEKGPDVSGSDKLYHLLSFTIL